MRREDEKKANFHPNERYFIALKRKIYVDLFVHRIVYRGKFEEKREKLKNRIRFDSKVTTTATTTMTTMMLVNATTVKLHAHTFVQFYELF